MVIIIIYGYGRLHFYDIKGLRVQSNTMIFDSHVGCLHVS